MVFVSSCGMDCTHPPSAAGLVAFHSMSQLMPPVIAVVGTRLVPPLAMGRPSSPGVVACGRRTGSQPCMYCRSDLIWAFLSTDQSNQRLMRILLVNQKQELIKQRVPLNQELTPSYMYCR